MKVIIGAAATAYDGWISTNRSSLDITKKSDWEEKFKPAELDALLAEHVIEHLFPHQTYYVLKTAWKYLKDGGYFRIAVPDGYHPNKNYIEKVKPDGDGLGSEDHKVLWNIDTLGSLIKAAGFQVRALEYMDKEGAFQAVDWDPEDGYVRRSARFDARNKKVPLTYTSLIIDAVKNTHTPSLIAENESSYTDLAHLLDKKRNLSYHGSIEKSAQIKQSVAADNAPLPWYSYPAIEFIESLLQSKDLDRFSVFEYGAGKSTSFYADYGVSLIRSVESNPEWFSLVDAAVGDYNNVDLLFRDLGAASTAIKETSEKYDLVVIDGRMRVDCVFNCVENLKDNAIVLLDNSDRPKYGTAIRYLQDLGFIRIDFCGLCPGISTPTATSVFLHDPEILNQLIPPYCVKSSFGLRVGQREYLKKLDLL